MTHTIRKRQVVGHGETMRLHGVMLAIVKAANIIVHEVGDPFLLSGRHREERS